MVALLTFVHFLPLFCFQICMDTPYRSFDGSCNNLKRPFWGSDLFLLFWLTLVSLRCWGSFMTAFYWEASDVRLGWSRSIFVCGQRPRNYLSCCPCSCCCSPFGSFPHFKGFLVKKCLPGRDSNRGPFHQHSSALSTKLQNPSCIGRWKILIYCRRPRTRIGRLLFHTLRK